MERELIVLLNKTFSEETRAENKSEYKKIVKNIYEVFDKIHGEDWKESNKKLSELDRLIVSEQRSRLGAKKLDEAIEKIEEKEELTDLIKKAKQVPMKF